MALLLFLSGVFILTFLTGKLLEKKHIPWIFAALLIGFFLSWQDLYSDVTSSPEFLFLAELGMYFLLFIIGFELNLANFRKQGKFIVNMTFNIIFLEALLGTLIIHYIFDVSWIVSLLVASSFATVGEALLLPILDEFGLVRTKLGQTILGVGVLDDVVEIITVVLAALVIGQSVGHTHFNLWVNMLLLFLLFGLVYLLVRWHKQIHIFKFKDIPSIFLFILFFIFLFIGIGKLVESAALGALLSGIAIRNIIPDKRIRLIDSEIRTMSYGFFAPIFFLWVGLNTDISYVIQYYPLVILVVVMTAVAKILPAYIYGKEKLGKKKSIILGTGLMVKLSTSIVIIKLLSQKGLIGNDLYSVLITATAIFSLLVPLVLSYQLKKWKIGLIRVKRKA